MHKAKPRASHEGAKHICRDSAQLVLVQGCVLSVLPQVAVIEAHENRCVEIARGLWRQEAAPCDQSRSWSKRKRRPYTVPHGEDAKHCRETVRLVREDLLAAIRFRMHMRTGKPGSSPA